MGRGSQRDHSVTLATGRAMKWRASLRVLMARRHLPSPSSTSAVLMHCIKRCTSEQGELLRFSERSNRISLSSFSYNFNAFTDVCCLSLFRFRKQDVIRMVTAIAWKREITTRNSYMCSPLLVTCVVLRRLTTPHAGATWRCCSGSMEGNCQRYFGREWKASLKPVSI